MFALPSEPGDAERRVDYYEVLGVPPTASAAEIKSAYRSRVKVAHPDAGGAADTFRLLQRAYQALGDPRRRAAYDRGLDPGGSAGRPTRRAVRRFSVQRDLDVVPPLPVLDVDHIPWLSAPHDTRAGEPAADPGAKRVRVALAELLRAALRRSADASAGALTGSARGGVGPAVFGRPGTEHADVAERLTAQLLGEYLTRLPGTRIFHGLAWPGSVYADVDHAVLCGRRLVLVESKLWLPGHYTADECGQLWRNGHRFRGGALRLPDGIASFRQRLPGVQVRGAVLIHPCRPGTVTTGEPGALPAPPMHPDRFVREVGQWLADGPAAVDQQAFRTVLAQVVSA